MIVEFRNKKWELSLDYDVFVSFRKSNPGMRANITELTDSTYKEQRSAPLEELEDVSITRNKLALQSNHYFSS